MTEQEVWDLAVNIYFSGGSYGDSEEKFDLIFKGLSKEEVFLLSMPEIKQLIKEYEDRFKIKPGDLVIDKDGTRCFVLDENPNYSHKVWQLLDENGCVVNMKESLLRKVSENPSLYKNLLSYIRNFNLDGDINGELYSKEHCNIK